MINSRTVTICTGAGCKGWNAERIAQGLREAGADLGLDELEIRSVPCMKRCGGGVSIQVSACNSLLKFKREEEAVNVLIPEKMIPVPA